MEQHQNRQVNYHGWMVFFKIKVTPWKIGILNLILVPHLPFFSQVWHIVYLWNRTETSFLVSIIIFYFFLKHIDSEHDSTWHCTNCNCLYFWFVLLCLMMSSIVYSWYVACDAIAKTDTTVTSVTTKTCNIIIILTILY